MVRGGPDRKRPASLTARSREAWRRRSRCRLGRASAGPACPSQDQGWPRASRRRQGPGTRACASTPRSRDRDRGRRGSPRRDRRVLPTENTPCSTSRWATVLSHRPAALQERLAASAGERVRPEVAVVPRRVPVAPRRRVDRCAVPPSRSPEHAHRGQRVPLAPIGVRWGVAGQWWRLHADERRSPGGRVHRLKALAERGGRLPRSAKTSSADAAQRSQVVQRAYVFKASRGVVPAAAFRSCDGNSDRSHADCGAGERRVAHGSS